LEPKYEELGKKIKKKYDNVVIAKMDATGTFAGCAITRSRLEVTRLVCF